MERIAEQAKAFKESQLLVETLGKLPLWVLILNSSRQVVHASSGLLGAAGRSELKEIMGLRPGEVLGCVHAHETPEGCGTSRSCAYCDAVQAVLESRRSGKPVTRDARITLEDRGHASLDLRVWAIPMNVEGEEFTLVAMQDVAAEKARTRLERVFFQDLANEVAGLNTLLFVTTRHWDRVDPRALVEQAQDQADRIRDEIQYLRVISELDAGMSGPVLETSEFDLADFLEDAVKFVEPLVVKCEVRLVESPEVGVAVVNSDRSLLRRIVVNMLKNAIEATEASTGDGGGGEVTLGGRVEEADGNGEVLVWVRNEGHMAPDVASQVFQRSFSTKGPGRGLGTYSMRMLAQFLGGSVDFTSAPGEGTTFRVRVPASPPAAER
ncbi:MAG: PAS domain-containing sensor histidine kinase [Promethearchaeota archaeon]